MKSPYIHFISLTNNNKAADISCYTNTKACKQRTLHIQYSLAILMMYIFTQCPCCSRDKDSQHEANSNGQTTQTLWCSGTKFDKFICIISKRSHTHEENTCILILYTLSLKKKLHTCIIPCNTTLVWHIDKISTKYTHIIMDTFIILLF